MYHGYNNEHILFENSSQILNIFAGLIAILIAWYITGLVLMRYFN